MTAEQRLMAVTLLANAIRKHERDNHAPAVDTGAADLARLAGARGRATASHQYVRGMIDLLAVLFEGGRPFAESCYEEARRLADGTQPPGRDRAGLN
jgi:hypothetical protein